MGVRVLLIYTFLIGLSGASKSVAAEGTNFPFLGTYGDPSGSYPGCNDAKLEREGNYITFEPKRIFIHESFCTFVSWSMTPDDGVTVTRRCGKTNSFNDKFKIDRSTLIYRGRMYLRCAN